MNPVPEGENYLKLSNVMKLSVGVFLHRPVFFLLMSLAVAVPAVLMDELLSGLLQLEEVRTVSDRVAWGLLQVPGTVINIVGTAVIVAGALQILSGQTLSPMGALGWVVAVWGPVLHAGLMMAAGFSLTQVLFLPGVILLDILWYVVVPVLLIERLPVRQTFRRSLEVIRGNMLIIAVVSLILFAVNVSYFLILPDFVGLDFILSLPSRIGFLGVLLCLSAILTAVVYSELRRLGK